MSNFLFYILIGVIFSIPLILYMKLYFKRISMISLSSDGTVSVVSLKPYKRHLSDLLGDDVSVCCLRDGYVVFYNCSDHTGAIRYNDQIVFPGPIIMAAVRRGRYSSVVVSDRAVSDLLNSFSFYGGK